jgi:hypothetical protein
MFEFIIWMAIIFGLVHGLIKVQTTKQNPSSGIPSSNNIFTYLFFDKY